jgi:hypothetical protein
MKGGYYKSRARTRHRRKYLYQVVEKLVFPQAGQKHPDARRAKS